MFEDLSIWLNNHVGFSKRYFWVTTFRPQLPAILSIVGGLSLFLQNPYISLTDLFQISSTFKDIPFLSTEMSGCKWKCLWIMSKTSFWAWIVQIVPAISVVGRKFGSMNGKFMRSVAAKELYFFCFLLDLVFVVWLS